jgi:predicted DNA-binding protein
VAWLASPVASEYLQMIAFRDILHTMVTITHRIDEELKQLLDRYCEEHGLKVQAVVQEAIAQWLEDSEDLALVEQRRRGPWIAWEEVRDEI